MPYIIATVSPLWWAIRENGTVIETGITRVGDLTVTGLEIISNASENAFLGAVANSAGDYNPLPVQGEWCEANRIYGDDNGGLVICRTAHPRTADAPADMPERFAVYQVNAAEALTWVPDELVNVGTRRLYKTMLYTCLRAHQTQVDAPPTAALGVLWAKAVQAPP